MSWNEFELITRYLEKCTGKRQDVLLGIGDDCALLKVPKNKILAVTIDTLVKDVHFFADTPAYFLGFKSLAISLSDLAAMGADPAWVTLSLVLDDNITEEWLAEFCRGFSVLLQHYNLQLVGGNIARGPLNITTQLHGFLPENKALLRSKAQIGDSIYVTGNLGDAGRALELMQISNSGSENELNFLRQKLYCPTPRICEGLALLDVAKSAIDISDGLAADLQHVLDSSRVGATIYADKLPISSWLRQSLGDDWSHAWQLALGAGDDYELCFTVPSSNDAIIAKLEIIAQKCGCIFTNIGMIEAQQGLRVKQSNGQDFIFTHKGYVHKNG